MILHLTSATEGNVSKRHLPVAGQQRSTVPSIWHYNTYVAAVLKILSALLIVSMPFNGYSYRTLKQNLIDGLSKREFVLSKFITVIGFALISTLFVFIVSMILGLSFSDYTELGIIFSDMEYLLAYFVKLMGFFAFCLFLGVWVKRSAFAIGFLVVWWIVESILYALMKWQCFKGTDIAENVAQFFPLTAMSNLIKEPFSRLGAVQSAANQLGEAFTKTYEVGLLPLAIVLVWTFLFVYWSYALLKRRDL